MEQRIQIRFDLAGSREQIYRPIEARIRVGRCALRGEFGENISLRLLEHFMLEKMGDPIRHADRFPVRTGKVIVDRAITGREGGIRFRKAGLRKDEYL
ncbi:hypothetical protein D3C71_1980070 [compost metagenome]